MIVGAVAAFVAFREGRTRLIIPLTGIGFAAAGTLLAADAWRTARRPPIREVFDEAARAERAEATAEGRVVPEDASVPVVVEGVLRRDASNSPAGAFLRLSAGRLLRAPGSSGPREVDGGVAVTVVGSLAPGRVDEWRAGRRVRLSATLRRAARYLNFGVADAERGLALRGDALVGTVKSAALVDVIARGWWLDERAGDARAFARRAIGRSVARWSPRSAALVTAIVIGDRAGLDEDVERQMQDAGTYHVVAISGGNVALFAGALIGLFRLSGVLGRTAMIAAILVLLSYAYTVGAGASVERATSMAVVYLAARALDHRAQPINTLASVAACLVVVQPLLVADPGFVLTCGATGAILVAMPLVSRCKRRVVRALVALILASLAAEIMLLPVGALLFSRITVAGLALNVLAVPLMAVAQMAGLAVVAMSGVSPVLADQAGLVAHLGAAGLVQASALVRFAPFVVFRVAAPSWLAVLLYYGALAAAFHRPWRGRAALTVAGAALWIVAEPWTWVVDRGDGRLHAVFIDVGQGDSALIRLPRGGTLLVDAGGLPGASGFDIGDRVVAPVLRQSGVRRLDDLVLTHGDPDHIGGIPAIFREFRPRRVWEGISVPKSMPLTELHEQGDELGLEWASVHAGDRIAAPRGDEVELAVLNPEPPDWERQRVRNDDSVVVELRWRRVSLLLTGDIGRDVEPGVARRMARAPLRIVKVAHHGSATSSVAEFVNAVAPSIAIVSAGRANRFGHPAEAVIERYREAGAEVFRTDQDGAITIDTDGYSVNVQTFTGRTTTIVR
jgi:competence protein ComEC